jgi:hypothetical protein
VRHLAWIVRVSAWAWAAVIVVTALLGMGPGTRVAGIGVVLLAVATWRALSEWRERRDRVCST